MEIWQNIHQETIVKYPDLISLVWAQVQKDFATEALDIRSDKVDTLDAIYRVIYPEITKHIQFDFNAVMRLLYRIDISEGKVKRQMELKNSTLKKNTLKQIKRMKISCNIS